MACPARLMDDTSSGFRFSELMSGLLRNSETHDVKFLFGEIQIGAHRNVLAQRSPAFRAMFYGSMKEKEPSTGINIQDCTVEAFTAMLQWIYTNEVTITAEIAQTLLYNAKRYLLDDLLPVLRKWLEDNLDSHTACILWQQAVFLDEDDFALKCERFCFANADQVLSSDGVVELSRDQLKALLSHKDSNILDELNAYQAVIRWGREQCALGGGHSDDVKALRAQLSDLVQLVRLPLLTPGKLACIVHGQDNTINIIPHKVMALLLAWSAARPQAEDRDRAFGDWWFCVVCRQPSPCRFAFVTSWRASFRDKHTAVSPTGTGWNGVDTAPNLPTSGCHFVQFQRLTTDGAVMIGVNLCNAFPPQGKAHFQGTGLMFHLGSGTNYTSGKQRNVYAMPAQGDIIGCKLDMHTRTVDFTINGLSVGTPFSDIAPGQYKFVCDLYNGASVRIVN
eukprot:TRINITY_DN678_c0_g1_i4.p1 TRINITY_DN678_c0_g1~~TRINITY_DN678_c0_g1_i4.p1  ORF type:complete len:449 (+),score=74.70 TRINITY_DN678_c0_g1_i4:81-1427(+)